MLSPCCLCVCMFAHLHNFWIPKPIFMKQSTYIMKPEPMSTVAFINSNHQSMCLYMYVARQRLDKIFIAATNTHVITEQLLDA
jgi:hypothetical protein